MLLSLCLVATRGGTTGFSFVPQFQTTRGRCSSVAMPASSNAEDDDTSSPQQRVQENLMEQLSLAGAEKIAQLDIPERAKRAMLAEAIEDRIFDLTEVMESLFDENNMLPESNREKAVELAQQTKSLQIQYGELVSGGPSSVLQSLEDATKSSSKDGAKDE